MADKNIESLPAPEKEDSDGDDFDNLLELCDDCGFPNCVLLHATDLRGKPFDPTPRRSSLFKVLKSSGDIMFAEGEGPIEIVCALKQLADDFCFGYSGGVYGARKDIAGTGAFLPPPPCVIAHINDTFNPNNKKRKAAPGGSDEKPVCQYCDLDDCVLFDDRDFEDYVFASSFKNHLDLMANNIGETGVTNKQGRFQMYRECSRFFFGYLGHGVRKRLPSCAEMHIRSLFPSEDGEYVGYKESASSSDH